MSIEERIKGIRMSGDFSAHSMGEKISYKTGHRDAKDEAATLAAEADELMLEMETAIDGMLGMYAHKHCDDAMNSDECHSACEILERYNNWKEQNQ